MHGNAAEWTRSPYRPYPFTARAEPAHSRAGEPDPTTRYVVRGGSWRDRPRRCTSAWRWRYPAFQKPFNVGFRVISEGQRKKIASRP